MPCISLARSSTFLPVLILAASCAAGEEPWVPFHLPWESPAGAIAGARFLLDAPAGKHGPLVMRGGHFHFENGERVRFWGINLSGEGCLPPPDVAPRVADRLAKFGFHVGRRFTAGDGLPQTEMLGYGKYCVIFDPWMIELQKDYARRLLGHRNSYTGRTYAEDPAVVIVELTNENSLFGGWNRQSSPRTPPPDSVTKAGSITTWRAATTTKCIGS